MERRRQKVKIAILAAAAALVLVCTDRSGPSQNLRVPVEDRVRMLGAAPDAWTEDEHDAFLRGLAHFGPPSTKKWNAIARVFVGTRSGEEVRDHWRELASDRDARGGAGGISLLPAVAMDPKTVRPRAPAPDAPPPAAAATPVFYNAFAASEADVPRVASIVAEQLALLRPEHEVRVRSIGAPVASALAAIPDPPGRGVRLVAHDDAGDEAGTLRLLWDHCVANPSGAAVYLHSKGSFHPSRSNDDLRRFISRGALSGECAAATSDGGACDVCSSRFSPLPHPHAPGNMWIARCDHVRRLRDPAAFASDMDRAPSRGSGSCAGRGRFAAEHWVHSHPRTRPCDLYESAGHTSGYSGVPRGGGGEFAMDLRPAPRFDRSVFVRSKPCRKQHAGELEDRLMEYEALYGEKPSDEWWGWKFFGAIKMEGDVT